MTLALAVTAVTLVGVMPLIDYLDWTYEFFPADMSPALFKHFASLGKGVIQIKWHSG